MKMSDSQEFTVEGLRLLAKLNTNFASPRDKELQQALEILDGKEREVYQWLRDFFSLSWVAETVMMPQPAVNQIAESIYKKLNVRNQIELIFRYGALYEDDEAEVT